MKNQEPLLSRVGETVLPLGHPHPGPLPSGEREIPTQAEPQFAAPTAVRVA